MGINELYCQTIKTTNDRVLEILIYMSTPIPDMTSILD